MKLYRPARKPQPETIVSLIDVVFFLLVFALLIGRMDATAPFSVSPPIARTGEDLPAGGITVSVGEDGVLAMNGEVLARDILLSYVKQIAAVLPETRVRLNADATAKLRGVLPLLEDLRKTGAENVVIIVTPDAE